MNRRISARVLVLGLASISLAVTIQHEAFAGDRKTKFSGNTASTSKSGSATFKRRNDCTNVSTPNPITDERYNKDPRYKTMQWRKCPGIGVFPVDPAAGGGGVGNYQYAEGVVPPSPVETDGQAFAQRPIFFTTSDPVTTTVAMLINGVGDPVGTAYLTMQDVEITLGRDDVGPASTEKNYLKCSADQIRYRYDKDLDSFSQRDGCAATFFRAGTYRGLKMLVTWRVDRIEFKNGEVDLTPGTLSATTDMQDITVRELQSPVVCRSISRNKCLEKANAAKRAKDAAGRDRG